MRCRLLAFLLLFQFPGLALAGGGTVSSADGRASEAGRQILREGGSATDAAMAMMLALTVVEPQSSGIGGGGFLVIHDAKTGKAATIDGREIAPLSARPEMFLNADGKPRGFMEIVPGGLSVGVPGNIALMAQSHKRWGKIKWAALFQPAIRLAEEGFVVSPILETRLANAAKIWGDFPEARALYFQDGRPKRAGEVVKNPALAALLKQVATKGPKAFYKGQNARAIADATGKTNRNPAVISVKEIGRYKAKGRDAVCTTYRIYTLCGMGPPSSGATTVFQILGMLERFDLTAMGKDDPQSWHLIAEAMQLAYADRDKYLADADFVSVPVTGLLDKSYIASRSALISSDTVLASYEAGTPPGAEPHTTAISSEVEGTTHFVAVDGAGNVASMTSTIEGPFGSQLIANGYFLNNELTDFTHAPMLRGQPVANRVQPGKRPLSSMSPTIVYGPDGKPVFAVGAAGGKTIIMQVTKTLIAHLDWGLPARDAIAAPNIYFQPGMVTVEAKTPLADLATELSAYGRMVMALDMPRLKANAAERTAQGWVGAADPRGEGVALAE